MTQIRIQIIMGNVTEGFVDTDTLDIEATNAAYAAEYERRIQAEYPGAEVSVTAQANVSMLTRTSITGADFDEHEAIEHNLDLIAERLIQDQDSWLVTITPATIGYTCYGSVRGCCGELHSDEETAQAHAQEDGQDCAAENDPSRPSQAYSDRNVYAVDSEGYLIKADGEPLMEAGHAVRYAALVG